jgi:formylglycine-generating enzyme required for sulfatase activity
MGNNKGDVDEVPEHEVYVKPFFMSKYEVTQKVWKNIMGYNHSSFGECDECPVENINYGEIEAFFGTLNGMCSGRKYRLPSEAEWEFAAKGGVYSKGFKYAGSNDANKVGWTQNNSGKKTHHVGLLQPNELGLFDMTGNVLEFCSDTFCYYPNAKIKYCDPSQQIARGGSWLGAGSVTDRGNKTRDYKDSTYGFRLVCDY